MTQRIFPKNLKPSLQSAIASCIRLYQRTLSPDTGFLRHWYPYGCCRFSPTCSRYALDAVARFGVFRGTLLAVRRLTRCHPWHACGFDPVPQKRP